MREWLDVYTANGDSQLVCAWRKRAWRAMRPVVELFVADREKGIEHSAGYLNHMIEAARVEAGINDTGKRWRQEHGKIVQILRDQRELWPTPSQEEADACMVARDAEEAGNIEAARTILRDQVPHALNRKCPACGT